MRRLAAIAALGAVLAAVVLAVAVTINAFPAGIIVLGALVLAAFFAWQGVVRGGAAQLGGLALSAVLVAGAVVLIFTEHHPLADAIIVALVIGSVAAARVAFRARVRLPAAPRPEHPVLFFNPKSGGGKAVKFRLADEAAKRGIEAVELKRDDDLRLLVREALDRGADALAAAGGDGTQAIVAELAAERGVPFACIPAGTRNHFALDLGVDRNDVVGALDALVDGGERCVDLAEVNGRIFVNNVSLGLYAEAVQKEGYRDAKLRTIADTAAGQMRPNGARLDVRWTGPDGRERATAGVMLVSNDPYRLGRLLASGTRPRLDAGVLGIAVAEGPEVLEWSTPRFEVTSHEPVPAGIDGEAAKLDPPLVFVTRPGALRVRIAPHHPGASPSANLPAGPFGVLRELARVAFTRSG